MANRLTQIPGEILTTGGNPNVRVTQEPKEVLTRSGNPSALITQVPREILTRLQTPNVRLTQAATEVLVQIPSSSSSYDPIFKLQPHRTMHMRGTGRNGAMGALWNASATGFDVTGVFRDMDDFAVLMLWDADDYFGHYQTSKYLPDFDFTGVVLSYNYQTSGLMSMDDPRFQWIPWRSLSYVKADGTRGTVDLGSHSTVTSGTLTAASTSVTVNVASSSLNTDRVTIWYQNQVFYWWPNGGVGVAGDSAATIASSIASQINSGTSGLTMPLTATVVGSTITITSTVKGVCGNSITLYTQQNGSNVTLSTGNNAAVPLTGGVSNAVFTVTIDFSALSLTSLRQAWLTFAPQIQGPTGGNPWPTSDYQSTEWSVLVTNWTVSDPSSKTPLKVAGAGSVRVGSRDSWVSYGGSSWTEEASNQPGGTGWFHHGFAHRMGDLANAHSGDSVTINYSCQSVHDLYVGTSLSSDRGIVSVTVDGVAQADLDCYQNDPNNPLVTRRVIATSVAAGTHKVVLTLKNTHNASSSGYYFYFDFLEAAVKTDVPKPTSTFSNVMPATDYDTDHGYKLSPQRLLWLLQNMGFAGDINHYMGVFWWNQRKRVGGSYPVATVTFGGTWQWSGSPDTIFLNIGGSTIGKTVFPEDNSTSIAAHFAYFINSGFTGVRATASGAVLTITTETPEFQFSLQPTVYNSGTTYALNDVVVDGTGAEYQSKTNGNVGNALSNATYWTKLAVAGTVTVSGNLTSGVEGTWQIDDTITPVINKPVRDWMTDWWQQVKNAGLTGVASFSMELVNPPSGYAQEYADSTPVETATGFGGLNSTQCTFNSTMQAYQKEAFKEMAGFQNAAGLVPRLQFGEFLWWFFPGSSPTDTKGMAYYDPATASAAVTALGRPLATFTHPTDSPSINSFADANFLRGLIYSHCQGIISFVQATYASATFEVLWPYDVNYPTQTPVAQLGGQLNRYVNLPSQWQTNSGSGLVRMKMEALAFGATERNATLFGQAITFPTTSPLTWPLADTAYLVPVFNGGCPWPMEYLAAKFANVPSLNFWAFDHICLLSWPVKSMPAPVPSVVNA